MFGRKNEMPCSGQKTNTKSNPNPPQFTTHGLSSLGSFGLRQTLRQCQLLAKPAWAFVVCGRGTPPFGGWLKLLF